MYQKMPMMIVIFMFFSCTKPERSDLKFLSGYWEINKVITGNDTKEFTINETIEHFSFKDNSGVRTKLRPQFDGSFIKGGAENFVVKDSVGKIYLVYNLAGRKWEEELVELNEDKLVLRNSQPIEYHFKKHEPFSIK